MRRNAHQKLIFPQWPGVSVTDLSVITWADASNHNRSDKGSTIGALTGLAPRAIMDGQETQVALIQWKSGREVLGSNGAEDQSVTVAEGMNYQIRGLLYELLGNKLDRKELPSRSLRSPEQSSWIREASMTPPPGNLSCLHGLRDSRAGYELTLAVAQAQKAGTQFRWVCGAAQLADEEAARRPGVLRRGSRVMAEKCNWPWIESDVQYDPFT
jgi:hypothetical protein